MNIELTPMTKFQFRVDPLKYVTSHETQEYKLAWTGSSSRHMGMCASVLYQILPLLEGKQSPQI